MNSTFETFRTTTAGRPAARVFRAVAPLTATSLTRAGLPVVSNRAFINAWASRRTGLPRVPSTRSR